MDKRLTKPYEKNVRLSTPTGLVGVPPEATEDGGDTYIIVTDKKTAERVIDILFPEKSAAAPQ